MIYLILFLIVMTFVIYKVQLIYRHVFLTLFPKERQTLSLLFKLIAKSLSSKAMIKQIWTSNAYFRTVKWLSSENLIMLNDSLDRLEQYIDDIQLTLDDVLFDITNSTGARKEHVLVRTLQTYIALSLEDRVPPFDLDDMSALLTTDIPADAPGIPVPVLLKLYQTGVDKYGLNGQIVSLTITRQITRLIEEVKKDN
mgnify:CR=1 FL=1